MKRFLILGLIFLLSLSVFAKDTSWEFDKAHTNIGFSIAHMVVTDVTGRFNDFNISLTAQEDDFENSSVEVVIKTGSINTEDEKRDAHLRSADFFNVEKHPEIKFKSTSFKKTGENTYDITGDLTMNGVTKQVVFLAKFNGLVKDPWGNTRAGFKATTILNRYDFNLIYNSPLEAGGLLIGKEVEIAVNAEFIKK